MPEIKFLPYICYGWRCIYETEQVDVIPITVSSQDNNLLVTAANMSETIFIEIHANHFSKIYDRIKFFDEWHAYPYKPVAGRFAGKCICFLI